MLSLMAKTPRQDGRDGLRASLGKALDADKKRRLSKAQRQATIEKAEKRRRDKSAGDAMLIDDKIMVNSLVTPEARAHGDYRAVDFKFVEVTEGGKRVEKISKVVRNLGGTPIERWSRLGRLDERQMAAILFYQAAWRQHIGEPRVTANYSPAVRRGANQAIELWASSRMRAKEALRLLDQEVFFRIPIEHFEVWQNVTIWDEPAGVAGARVGFCHKPAEAAALLIVSLVAGMIADVVITNDRRDFGDLLLDIDAPRRPRRRRA